MSLSSVLWGSLKQILKAIANSNEFERLLAFILNIWWKVPYNEAISILAQVRRWVLEAAKKFPKGGSGQQKWDWVWESFRDTFGEFLENYGAQTVELIVIWMVKIMTARGEKT